MARGIIVEIDAEKAIRAVNASDGIESALAEKAAEIAAAANALGAGFETEQTVRWATGEHVGGTSPEYGSDVKRGAKGPVGIVMTRNYAAMKDNHENNTLLKAKG